LHHSAKQEDCIHEFGRPSQAIWIHPVVAIQKQTRQHGQWEMLFRGFLAPGAEPDTEPELCEFEDSINKRGLVEEPGLESSSPLKKPKATPKSSRMGAVVDLTSLEANPSSEEFVKDVGTNFKVIASQLYDIQASLTIHDLPAMDHHLSNLQRLIGDRPDGQAPHEILAYLEILESSIQKLRDNPQTTLAKLEQHQLHLLLQQFGPTLQGLRDDIETSVTTYLKPMNPFFQQHPRRLLLDNHWC
jgi:hypothetical protein